MKHLRVFILLLVLLLAIPIKAQYGSGNGSYGTIGPSSGSGGGGTGIQTNGGTGTGNTFTNATLTSGASPVLKMNTNELWVISAVGTGAGTITNVYPWIWQPSMNVWSNTQPLGSTGGVITNNASTPNVFQIIRPNTLLFANLTNTTPDGVYTNSASTQQATVIQGPDLYTAIMTFYGSVRLTNPVVSQLTAFPNSTLGSTNVASISIGTNDTINSQGPTSAEIIFNKQSSTNGASVLWNGDGGFYAELYNNSTHDNALGRPQDNELELIAANNISIIPNNANGGGVGHVQMGGAQIPSIFYMQAQSNWTVFPFISGSDPLAFRSLSFTNGNAWEMDPAIYANWNTTGSNVVESHFYIDHDMQGTATTAKALPANPIHGLDMYMGTNGATFYTGAALYGRSGTTTNSVIVDTNGVNITGTLTNKGVSSIPTNAAVQTRVTSSGLHTIAMNKPWTNDLGARADLFIAVSSTAQYTNVFALTNTTSGDSITNTFIVITGGVSISPQNQTLIYPDISPNDIGTFSNYSAQSTATIVTAWWKLK